MVLVTVNFSDITQRQGVPNELSGCILPSQWAVICDEVSAAITDAEMLTCCCEVATCVVFAFPCIFFCHPCLSKAVIEQNVRQKLQHLNTMLFDGNRVMRLQTGHILFEMDYIRTTEPLYVYRTNTGDYSYSGKSGDGVSSPVQAVPVSGDYGNNGAYVAVMTANPVTQQPPVTQSMIVRVPPHAGPGSVLSVTAPNGLVLSVVVPTNLGPTRELNVTY